MFLDLFTFLLLLFFIAPVSLLLHEIGHAVGAKLMHASKINITIGTGKIVFEGSIKGIQIVIRRLFIINSLTSTFRDDPFNKQEKMIISILGPGFSGILAGILYMIYHAFIPSSVLYIFFLFNVWLVFINILPLKIGQKESDGYTIYKILFRK